MSFHWDPPRPARLPPRFWGAVDRQWIAAMDQHKLKHGFYPRDWLVRWTSTGSGPQVLAVEPVP